ncbi:MAG: histidine kinase [Aquimarina sp.]|nr:histidine kinase [Aquimarina sp.]
MDIKSNDPKYERARKRVEQEKGFYGHLTAYIIINIALILVNLDMKDILIEKLRLQIFITPLLWGIGLLIHGLVVFGKGFKLFKNWEEKKIKELMDKDDF